MKSKCTQRRPSPAGAGLRLGCASAADNFPQQPERRVLEPIRLGWNSKTTRPRRDGPITAFNVIRRAPSHSLGRDLTRRHERNSPADQELLRARAGTRSHFHFFTGDPFHSVLLELLIQGVENITAQESKSSSASRPLGPTLEHCQCRCSPLAWNCRLPESASWHHSAI